MKLRNIILGSVFSCSMLFANQFDSMIANMINTHNNLSGGHESKYFTWVDVPEALGKIAKADDPVALKNILDAAEKHNLFYLPNLHEANNYSLAFDIVDNNAVECLKYLIDSKRLDLDTIYYDMDDYKDRTIKEYAIKKNKKDILEILEK